MTSRPEMTTSGNSSSDGSPGRSSSYSSGSSPVGPSGSVVLIDQEILIEAYDSGPEIISSLKNLLNELSQFYQLILLGSKDDDISSSEVLKILEDWDLDLIFSKDLVMAAAQLKYPLIDPRSFLAAAALAGNRPENCILVSNDPLLLVAASAAGMKTVSFPLQGKLSGAARRGILRLSAKVIDEDKGPTYVLKGRLVTMNPDGDVFEEARIVISAGKIAQIASEGQDISPEFRSAPEIETGGTIYPGLIDLHNHFVYNVLPLWPVTKRYTNRSQWSKIKTYSRDISLPIRALADSAVTSRAIVRYVEAKAILGGTTTGQGIRTQVEGGVSIFKGAMRNVEETDDPRLPEAGTRVPDLGLAEDEIKSFRNSLSKRKAYFYHLAEGAGNTARKRFLDLAANQLVQESLVGVHSLGLKPEDLKAMAEKRAKVVWSPFSNLLLYGRTLDLKALKDSGAIFSIGCDWSPSGGKNLLQELKVARFVVEAQKSGHSSQDLVGAVTCNPATILGWDKYLGSLKPGAFADLLVVEGTGSDPYDHLIDAIEKDIKLVIVHGIPRYGIKNIMQRIHSDAENDLETLIIGGEERSLYLYAPGSSLNDLTFAESRETLSRAMADLPRFLQSTKEENKLLKAMGMRAEQKFRILLDNELEGTETRTADLIALSAKTDWSKMAKSVELDGPEVDFPSYWERLNEQANIEDDLRQMLKKAYAG